MSLSTGQRLPQGTVPENGADLLNEVENRRPVSHGRVQVGSIRTEYEVALAINGTQQIGELLQALASSYQCRREVPTLKSVFIVTS